jgi:hypothetical protein
MVPANAADLDADKVLKTLLVRRSGWRTFKKNVNIRLMGANKAVAKIKIADRIPFQIFQTNRQVFFIRQPESMS